MGPGGWILSSHRALVEAKGKHCCLGAAQLGGLGPQAEQFTWL